MTEKPPPISLELVAWLLSNFPDTLPTPDTPVNEFYALCGEQRVIRRIEEERQRQHEDSLLGGILNNTDGSK